MLDTMPAPIPGSKFQVAESREPGCPRPRIAQAAKLTTSLNCDTLAAMNFGVLFEKVTDKDFPSGDCFAHVPSLGLTTHGLGIDGTRRAAADLLRLWIAEKRANGEKIPPTGETLFSTLHP